MTHQTLNMKIFTFLSAFVLVQCCALGQTIDVTWSSPQVVEKTTDVRPLGFANGRYLFAKDVEANANEVFLLSYDTHLTDPIETPLFTYNDEKSDEKTRLITLYLDSRSQLIHTLLYVVNLKQKWNGIRLHTFDAMGKPVGAPKELVHASPESSPSSWATADADVVFAPDSASLLIYHELPNKRPTSPSQLYLKVLSADFETTLWEKTILLPYTEKEGPLHGVYLNTQHQVFLKVGTEFKDLRRINHGITTYYVPTEQGFYRVSETGDLLPLAFDLGKNRIKSLNFEVDDAGESRIFCFIGPSNQSLKGDALLAQNWATETGQTANTKQIPIDFVYENVPANQRLNFVLTHSYLTRNQGTVIIAEQQEAKKEDVAGSFVQIGIPVWHFFNGALLVINLNADNSLKWATVIPKIQHTAGKQQRRYGSFYSMPFQDKLLFFYNDNAENVNELKYESKKFVSKAQEMKAATTLVATLDAEGKLTKQLIPGTESASGFTVVASEMVPLGGGKLLCVARWTEQFKVGVLSVSE